MTTDIFSLQFRLNDFVLKANTEGVSHAESLQGPAGGGNCMNWVLGHLLRARGGILEALGEEATWSQEDTKRYERGSAPLTGDSGTMEFSALIQAFSEAGEKIQAGLKRMDPERLNDPAPFSPLEREDETVGSLIGGLIFHEAYHAGQTGVIRRAIGKKGAIQ